MALINAQLLAQKNTSGIGATGGSIPFATGAAAATASAGHDDGRQIARALAEGKGVGVIGSLQWEDQDCEVSVTILVPEHTKPSDIRCAISTDTLKLEVLALPEPSRLVVQGAFYEAGACVHQLCDCFTVRHNYTTESQRVPCLNAVNPEGCAWSLEGAGSKRTLTIELEKQTPSRWLALTR